MPPLPSPDLPSPPEARAERLLGQLFEVSPVAWQIVDESGRRVLANRAFHEVRARAGAHCVFDLDGVQARTELAPQFARALAGETVRIPTYWCEHPPDNEDFGLRRIALEIELLPIFEDDQIHHVAIRYQDITTTLERERELQHLFTERELLVDRLQLILQRLPVACLVFDAEFRTVFVNEATERLLGYTSDELRGSPPYHLAFEQDRARILQMVASVAHGDCPPPAVGDVRTKDSRIVTAIWHATPLLDGEGHFSGMLCVGIDMTERVQTERALRRSEERYRSLVETTSAIVFTTDREVRFVAPQAAWEAYTGQSWDEHRDLGWMDAIHPDDRPSVAAEWAETRARSGFYESECRLYHADTGAFRHVVLRCAALFEESGEVREWIGTVVDIDDRRRAQDELGRLEAQAKEMQEASRLKSEFLANMSHELRTPLNAVLGFAELIADRVVSPDSPQHDEFMGHILTSGRHLLALINEVLDLAKIESGKLQFRPERASIPQLIDEVRAVLQATGVSRGVRIRTEVKPDLPEALLDPSRFKQVLYNYLSNALKFSPPDGTVIVRAGLQDATRLRLEVIDSGEGISPRDQARLFVEFQQLEGGISKRHAGTGLGLALTKRLVEAQGGEVGVHSAPGQGSTFFAVLPLRMDVTTLRGPHPSPRARTERAD